MNDPANFAPVEHLETLPAWFQLLSMVICSIIGAAVARSRNVPIFGTFLAGELVGFGGGITRDMMLGLEPVAISGWYYLPAGLVGSLIGALFFGKVMTLNSTNTTGLIIDGATMGLLVTIGGQKALDYNTPYFSAVFLGVVTASFGGMIADVITGHRATIVKQAHWVGSALFCGSLTFVVLSVGLSAIISATAAFWIATAAAVIVTSFLRTQSARMNWPSPMWRNESMQAA